jgi:predicted RNase H-like nuclease
LRAAGLPGALIDAAPPRGAAEDDVLDALACAAIARRIHAGIARPFPDPPPRDPHGLPMAIWA